jgi:hypothetical protein
MGYPESYPTPGTWRRNVVFACLGNDPTGTRLLDDLYDRLYDKMEEGSRQKIRKNEVGARLGLEYGRRAVGTAICGTVVSSSGQRVNRLYWYEKVMLIHGNTMAQHLASFQ